jgi:type IX secretion system PorP/SprF family membrane protein
MKKGILFIIIIFSVIKATGQDIHFSQLSSTSLFNSVASAGVKKSKLNSFAFYRSQWASIGNAYRTYGLTADSRFKTGNNGIGLGLLIYKDQAGALNFNQLKANLSIAYHLRVSQFSQFSGGVQLGITQHSIDESKAEWRTQFNGKKFDPTLPSQEQPLFESFTNFDAAAGFLWSYSNKVSGRFSENPFKVLNIGVSVYHISQTNIVYNANEAENMRYVVFGNTAFSLKKSTFDIEPSFLYQLKGKEYELVVGTMFKIILEEESYHTGYFKQFDLSIGGYYRYPNDAIIPAINMNYDSFGFGVSYDVNISELNQVSNYQGGLEFFIKHTLR